MALIAFPENNQGEHCVLEKQAILLGKLKDIAIDSWSVGDLNSRAVKKLLHPQTLVTEVSPGLLKGPLTEWGLGLEGSAGLGCSNRTPPALGECIRCIARQELSVCSEFPRG